MGNPSSPPPRGPPRIVRTAQRTVLVVLFDDVQSLDATGPVEVFAGAERHTPGMGSLLLGAAGPLKGGATSHWPALEQLTARGAEPTGGRVVVDGKCVTGAGVLAGIDGGPTLVGRIGGDDLARSVPPGTEYESRPPCDAGSPDKAPAHLVEALRARGRFTLRWTRSR
ncbi:hypothetical protein [Streptomyces sp. NPDC018610]|uniref:hypothetical protein n=1 Tax=Streptomyces sp. NPDC018610 TaxID=3365049 RepID=UPI0037ADC7D5